MATKETMTWAFNPLCPQCGDEISDSIHDEIFDGDGEARIDCGGCGAPSIVRREITVAYYARAARGALDESEVKDG